MHQIEIDFEVFKELTNRRQTEAITYNDVIRDLLGMEHQPKDQKTSTKAGNAWVVSDTSFPVGSEFKAEYNGKAYIGSVENGKLKLDDGSTFSTPSAAAVHITHSNANGWRFWKCKLPSTSQFVLIERLRGKVH